MPDHFATLAQPCRPWLDPEALRESFHRAAAQQHPDAADGTDERFTELNTAYAVLREPATRLRHLLELTAPEMLARPAAIPPALADLFMQLATLRRALDGFQQKASAVTSPLTRALLAAEKATCRHGVEHSLAQLTAATAEAASELHTLDTAWADRTPAEVEKLAALQARCAFLAKWSAQLREDLFRLSA